MAASKSSKIHHIPLDEDELCCPVCFDIFVVPKALPECQHNVCKKCLQDIYTRIQGEFVECPLCRVKSNLPPGGVDQLPTNHLIKKLVDGIPGRKEKQALEHALKDCTDKINVGKTVLESVNKLILDATVKNEERAQELKAEISEHARKLIEIIQNHEKKLCCEVDDFTRWNYRVLGLKTRKEKLSKAIKQTEVCMDNIHDLLRNNCSNDIVDLKDVLVAQLKELTEDLLVPKTSLESLETGDVIKFDKSAAICSDQNVVGSLTKQRKFNVNTLEKIKKVEDLESVKVDLDFEPLSIAISQTEEDIFVGILRSNEKRFDVLDIQGNRVKSVRLDAVPASHLYDINFAMADDTILVLDRIDKQLLNYSLDGRCIKTKHLNENIKYISVDCKERIILTTSRESSDGASRPSKHACCVLVFHPKKDELQLKFGEQDLISPSGRTIYHKNSFFVPDNYSDLKMFNDKGKFIQILQLNGINPTDYNIFSVDVYNDAVIACNTKKKFVKVFSIHDFSLISSINTPDVPWMIEALPTTRYGASRLVVIYDESTKLDVIEYK